MSKFVKCPGCPDEFGCGRIYKCPDAPSAGAMPDQGATPLVGTGDGSAETPARQINWSLRRQVAERLLDFWQHEFCTHNDGNARVQIDRAHAMLGDVNQAKHESSSNTKDEPRRH